MVKKKKKSVRFWIGLAVAIILLIVLYGFVIRKELVVDRDLINEVPIESDVSGADSETVIDVFENSDSTGSVGGGSSGGGSGSNTNPGDVGEITPPPVIPEVYDE